MNMPGYFKQNIQPGQKYAVLGIGSALRSDDNAGMYFVKILRRRLCREDLLFIEGSTAPENFTGVIKAFEPDKLFIIDAAHMGLVPGESNIIPVCDIGGVSFSTHMLPLTIMLKYLETEVGCEVIFIGIQPKHTDQGFYMSGEVKRGTERLAGAFYEAFNQKSEC